MRPGELCLRSGLTSPTKGILYESCRGRRELSETLILENVQRTKQGGNSNSGVPVSPFYRKAVRANDELNQTTAAAPKMERKYDLSNFEFLRFQSFSAD